MSLHDESFSAVLHAVKPCFFGLKVTRQLLYGSTIHRHCHYFDHIFCLIFTLGFQLKSAFKAIYLQPSEHFLLERSHYNMTPDREIAKISCHSDVEIYGTTKHPKSTYFSSPNVKISHYFSDDFSVLNWPIIHRHENS